MAARIGIELSPVTCRVIEIDGTAKGDQPRTRVRSFASVPRAELDAAHPVLTSLRGRHASVVVWTAHSSHRQVSVPNGPYERMRADALRGAAPSGIGQAPVLSDIAPAAAFVPGAHRRIVLLASAPRTELAEALRPLKDAGIVLDSVLTPASALASLARLRKGLAPEGSLEAYWAIEETASTLALTCDGHLLAARTAPWGYVSELQSRSGVQPRPREEITLRLAEDIAACLASAHADHGRLAQVCVCGGLPELRNMTLPLMEQLDVEVEPLDTLFGIDSTELPGPDDEFQERAAAFRLAWVAAADDRPLLDLARDRQRLRRKAFVRQVAVAAGVLVGLGMGWFLQRNWRPVSTSRRVAEVRQAAPSAPPVASAPAVTRSAPAGSPLASSPQPVASAPLLPPRPALEPGMEVILPGPLPQARSTPVPPPNASAEKKETAVSPPPAPPPAAPVRRSVEPLPPAAQPSPLPVAPVLATAPRATAGSTARPEAASAPPARPAAPTRTEPVAPPGAPVRSSETAAATPRSVTPPAVERPAQALPVQATSTPPPAARPASPPAAAARPASTASPRPAAASTADPGPASNTPAPLPFDASLGTILYGPERKLAIVDGRIVQAGDDVRGATVVEITPTSVYLRDAQGRLRRLTAGGTGR